MAQTKKIATRLAPGFNPYIGHRRESSESGLHLQGCPIHQHPIESCKTGHHSTHRESIRERQKNTARMNERKKNFFSLDTIAASPLTNMVASLMQKRKNPLAPSYPG